jgi:hypothetical protein
LVLVVARTIKNMKIKLWSKGWSWKTMQLGSN